MFVWSLVTSSWHKFAKAQPKYALYLFPWNISLCWEFLCLSFWFVPFLFQEVPICPNSITDLKFKNAGVEGKYALRRWTREGRACLASIRIRVQTPASLLNLGLVTLAFKPRVRRWRQKFPRGCWPMALSKSVRRGPKETLSQKTKRRTKEDMQSWPLTRVCTHKQHHTYRYAHTHAHMRERDKRRNDQGLDIWIILKFFWLLAFGCLKRTYRYEERLQWLSVSPAHLCKDFCNHLRDCDYKGQYCWAPSLNIR